MKARYSLLSCFAVLFVLCSYGLCMAQDQAATLNVKEIVLKADKGGKERVSVLCNQTCVPSLSKLEGKKARLIMDFARASFIEPKYRSMPVSGKYVRKIRSYLNHESNKLRVVLDMAPLKHFIVTASQEPTADTFSLIISEKHRTKGSSKIRGGGITIVDRIQKTIDKPPKPQKVAEKPEPVSVTKVAGVEKPTPASHNIFVDRGRSQMNAGDYKGAIKTFTQIIAENPKDSLPYRLRGNAYQNMGDRQKAIEDWTTAARLGDPIIRSYLDYMQIDWKEASKK